MPPFPVLARRFLRLRRGSGGRDLCYASRFLVADPCSIAQAPGVLRVCYGLPRFEVVRAFDVDRPAGFIKIYNLIFSSRKMIRLSSHSSCCG